MKRFSLAQLRTKESDLYRRVEDLRYTLYLHHHSPLYQLYKMHAELMSDIVSLIRKKDITTRQQTKVHLYLASIARLEQTLTFLQRLENSPYMTLLRMVREIKWSVSAIWYRTLSLLKGKFKSGLQASQTVFIIFGATPYSKEQSRGVQIAHALAERAKVVYIEPEFQTGYKPGFTTLPVLPTLDLVRLKKIKQGVDKSIIHCLKMFRKKGKIVRLIAMHPSWEHHLSRLKMPILYDRPHLHSALPSRKSHTIMAPHSKLGSLVVPNGVNMQAFSDASKTIQTCDVGLCWIKKPVIGYIGEMDGRIDEHAIGQVAKAFPKATVVLVGNTNYRPVIAVSEQHENIFPVGEQPYKNLSLYLQSFDILILPLKPTCKYPLTHESLPILLSSGKPIVAMTPFSVSKKWRTMLYVAKNHVTILSQVKRALDESKKSKKRKLRIAQARRMKWDVRKLLTLDS